MEDTRQDGEWGHENQGIGNDESKDGTMDRETQKTPLTYKKHNLSFNYSNKPSHRLQCNNKQAIGHLDFENYNLIPTHIVHSSQSREVLSSFAKITMVETLL